jgi:hypothetical protein
MARVPAGRRSFPPAVAVSLVKLARERPAQLGRSLAPWDGMELARPVAQEGMVERMSAETVRRLLEHHQLKPWRHHVWLAPSTPRDAACWARVTEVVDLDTRPLRADELVVCMEEQTSLPPRPRPHATRPAKPGLPTRVEQEYRRAGARNLCAGFATRTGQVYGQCDERQRQRECMAFLAYLAAEVPATVKTLQLVGDKARAHHGKQVRPWFTSHPRFVWHCTPVHGSWLNQVEPGFSILQRQRLRIVDSASLADLKAKLEPFMAEWHEVAHPFKWTTQSVVKVMADAPPAAAYNGTPSCVELY